MTSDECLKTSGESGEKLVTLGGSLETSSARGERLAS